MEPQAQHQNSLLVPLAIVVAGALIAAAVFFSGSGPNGGGSLVAEDKKVEVEPVQTKDHILGNPNAEVFVIEYSDLECPFCKVFHNTMHQVVKDYDGKVAWIYRHFPIEQLHKKAMKEAEASECAAELGGNTIFWKYIDEVFERTPSNDGLDLNELPKIALDLGINITEFNNCLSSGRYVESLKDGVEKAILAGARGTPYSIITDKSGKQLDTINGAEPIENIKLKIDNLLK